MIDATQAHRSDKSPTKLGLGVFNAVVRMTQAHVLSLCASIFVTSFIIYFLYSDAFGAHSDDQYYVVAFSRHLVAAVVQELQVLGRPLGLLSMSMLSPLFKIGGLPLAYIGVCVFLSIEILLVFVFFQMFLPRALSFGLA